MVDKVYEEERTLDGADETDGKAKVRLHDNADGSYSIATRNPTSENKQDTIITLLQKVKQLLNDVLNPGL